ncbi:MAG: hypothetical protein Q9208_005995 [Pyrenodesmia sp. 3 TL-2023]
MQQRLQSLGRGLGEATEDFERGVNPFKTKGAAALTLPSGALDRNPYGLADLGSNEPPAEDTTNREFTVTGSPDIRHRKECMTRLYIPDSTTRPKLEVRRQAANVGQEKFHYPILYWFPGGSEAEGTEIDPGYAGSRLQDWHVLRAYLWYGGNFELLSTMFNESFSKQGIKQNRVPCGRAATVWDEQEKEFKFVSIGNMMLCGDLGPRCRLDWKLNCPRTKGLMLHHGVPKEVGNAVPTQSNLLGETNTYLSGPEPMKVQGIQRGQLWAPELHASPVALKDVKPKRARPSRAKNLQRTSATKANPTSTRTPTIVTVDDDDDASIQSASSTRLVNVEDLEMRLDTDAETDGEGGKINVPDDVDLDEELSDTENQDSWTLTESHAQNYLGRNGLKHMRWMTLPMEYQIEYVLQGVSRFQKSRGIPKNKRIRDRRVERLNMIGEDAPWLENPVDKGNLRDWRGSDTTTSQMHWYISKLLGPEMEENESVTDREDDPVKLVRDLKANMRDRFENQGRSEGFIQRALEAFGRELASYYGTDGYRDPSEVPGTHSTATVGTKRANHDPIPRGNKKTKLDDGPKPSKEVTAMADLFAEVTNDQEQSTPSTKAIKPSDRGPGQSTVTGSLAAPPRTTTHKLAGAGSQPTTGESSATPLRTTTHKLAGAGLQSSATPLRTTASNLASAPSTTDSAIPKTTSATMGWWSEQVPGRIEPIPRLTQEVRTTDRLLERSMRMHKSVLETLRRGRKVNDDTIEAAVVEYNDIHDKWMAERNRVTGGNYRLDRD